MAQSFAEAMSLVPKSQGLAATLAKAGDYARAQSHRAVTLEHLLLALADDPEAGAVLRASNIDLMRLVADISGHLGRHEDRFPPGQTGEPVADADLSRIIEYATAAARQSRRRELNGAIVLAALVGDGKSAAADLLKAQGLTFEAAIKALQVNAQASQPRTAAAQPRPQPAPPQPTVNGAGHAPPQASTEEILATVRKRIGATRPPAPAAPPSQPPAAQAAAAAAQPGLSSYTPPAEPAYPAPQPQPPAQPQYQPQPQQQPPPPQQPQLYPAMGPDPGWAPPPQAGPATMPTRPVRLPPPLPPVPQSPPGPYAPPQPDAAYDSRPHWAAEPAPPLAPAPWPEETSRPAAQRPGYGPEPMPQQAPYRPQYPAPPRPESRPSAPARPFDPSMIVETIPRSLRVAIPEKVEVSIPRSAIRSYGMSLDGSGGVTAHDLVVTRAMSVRLRAPDGGFWIEPASPETQWIDKSANLPSDDSASWHWHLTPRRRGKARLQLVLSMRTVGIDGLTAETPLPEHTIEVRVRANALSVAARWGSLLLAAIVGGLIARYGSGPLAPLAGLIGLTGR